MQGLEWGSNMAESIGCRKSFELAMLIMKTAYGSTLTDAQSKGILNASNGCCKTTRPEMGWHKQHEVCYRLSNAPAVFDVYS